MFQSIIEFIRKFWKSQLVTAGREWNEKQDLEFKDWLYCHGLNVGIYKD